MALAAWLTTSLVLVQAASRPPLPMLCVEVDSNGARLTTSEVVGALEARMASRRVRVRECPRAMPAEPFWTLRVVDLSGTLRLELKAGELSLERQLDLPSRASRLEIAQSVALTVAEALRPTLDAFPTDSEESDPAPHPPSPPTPAPVNTPAPPPAVATSAGPRATLGARAGASLEDRDRHLSGCAGLEGTLPLGPLRAGLDLSACTVPSVDQASVGLRGWALEGGAMALKRWGRYEVGAGPTLRVALVRPVLAAPQVAPGTRAFWTAGVALQGRVRVLEFGPCELSLLARAAAWPRPNRYLVQGAPLLSESFLTFYLGPTLQFQVP